MKRVLRHTAIIVALLAMRGSDALRADTRPRIWLTPERLAALRVKAESGDADWLRLKADADKWLSRPMPRFTVTGASNGHPVEITIDETVPWTESIPVFIAGGSGAWAALNAAGDRPRPITATRTGVHTFTVPIDARAFGRFSGQRLALFFGEGEYSTYGFEGSEWQSALETLGLAYQVTRNAAYASKGIELVEYIASLGDAGMVAPAAIDSGFPSRSAVYGLAIAYDWLRDGMTAGERAASVRTINLWFDWFKRSAFENNGPAYGNYFGGHVLGYGLAGLATDADNPRGREIVEHVASLFKTHVEPAFATGGFAGGYPVESYTYGANHFQRLVSYMLAVQTATGDDLVARTGYAKKIARNLLYNLKPNGWQVSDEGDFAGDYTGVLQPSLPIVLSAALAGADEGRWMQHLCQNLAAAPRGGQDGNAFVRFLFYDRARPAADYRVTEPTWFRSPGDEHLYRRSSWQADAVWTSMAGGAANWAGHQMRGAGHIAIQRGGDYLLVNAGQWKGETGDFGSPQAFDLRSWRANTLFVDDGGDYLFTGADYAGGQGYWGTTRVLAHDGGADFAYMKSDLTDAYGVGDRKPWDARSVRSFQRSVLSMGGGVVVVFDRMQFREARYAKKLYFHVNPLGGRPAIAGDTASTRVGGSALFIRTLLPESPLLAVASDPVSDTDARTSTYRVEVSDSTPGAAFDALNVLVATAASTTAMPETRRLQSTNGAMVGAVVADAGVERIGLFAADGAAQSSVSYTATYGAGRSGFHVLADMTPHAPFVVSRNGATIATVAASSQGVLTFASPEGGQFTIRSQTAAMKHTVAASTDAGRPVPTGAETAPPAGSNPSSANGRFVAMVAPSSGERFTAPSTLRLVAAGRDPNVENNTPVDGRGGNASRLQFFVDYTMVLDVSGMDAEFWVFKGFVRNVAAGEHRVWARAIYTNPSLVLDSAPVPIAVQPPPVYARTIDLDADLTIGGDYQLIGSPAARIRVNGNGHRIVSGAGGAGAVAFQHVDFFDVGDRTATDTPAIDLTVQRGVTVEGCTFDGSSTVRLVANGSADASVRGNTFRSNMRQPLGQSPDGNGGVVHGSFPVLVLSGTSRVTKVVQSNQIAAGWMLLQATANWLVGGDAAADGNVLVGARVGIYADRSTNLQIRRNYSHHVYFGGWSQASNVELGGASSIVAEHNVIAGSSWPVRGVSGEFRYNLVLGAGHQWLWADHDGAHVHHNVFVGGDNDVGGIYVLYGVANVRIDHNTFDGLDGADAAAAVHVADGAVSLTSNLFFRMPKHPVAIRGGMVSADYNLSWASARPTYSDGRAPLHDVDGDPRLASPAAAIVDVDEARVWARALTVDDVLAQYRAKYTPMPGSAALDGGDPAGGADRPIGAIGRGVDPADRFGR